MKRILTLFPLFVLFTVSLSAGGIKDIYKAVKKLSSFEDARSFGYNNRGLFYVADAGSNEIFCIDTTGNMRNATGSLGTGRENFNTPSGIAVTPFSVFICDRNNKRIKELSYTLSTKSILNTASSVSSAFYPEILTVDNAGFLYLYDKEKSRVLRFSPNSETPEEIIRQNPEIQNASSLVFCNDKLFLLKDSLIVSFDSFGNFLGRILPEQKFGFLQVSGEKLLALSVSNTLIIISGQEEKNENLIELPKDEEVAGLYLSGENLYVLTSTSMWLYLKL